MLKLCAQTATVYVCDKADYTWRWEKAILIVASIKLWWCNSLNFPTKEASFLVTKLLSSKTPGLCSWFPRWTRNGTFFRIRPVVRSDCTAGTVKCNLGEYTRRVWGRGRKPSGIGVAECLLSALLKGDAWVVWQEMQSNLPYVCALQPAWLETNKYQVYFRWIRKGHKCTVMELCSSMAVLTPGGHQWHMTCWRAAEAPCSFL